MILSFARMWPSAVYRVPPPGLLPPPADDGREMDAPLFNVTLRHRLRVPVYGEDTFCPCCGQVLDKWGDHALTCACSWDRTIRHNAVRNVCFDMAVEAGLRPDREKAGLLPARPPSDGLPSGAGRRPADVWLPRGSSGRGDALHFAVTSGMRRVFQQYERTKREFQGTGQACEAAGFRFVPMVLEAHAGGFSGLMRATLDWVSRQAAETQHENHGIIALKIAQRISIALHRENARVVLKRAVVPEVSPQPTGWDDPGDRWH